MMGMKAFLAYFAFFAVVHSLLADEGAKGAARRAFGSKADRWYRAFYVVLSVIMSLPIAAFILSSPGKVVYSAPEALRSLMRAGQVAGAATAFVGVLQTDLLYFIGLRQIAGRDPKLQGKLVTDGLFCHVRNPLFLGAMAFLWLFPTMTPRLLAFNIAATVYFYLGALHEERTLSAEFGDEYRRYRERVPMFIPSIRCRR